MKDEKLIIVTPSKDVVDRAKRLGFEAGLLNERSAFFFGPSRCMGVVYLAFALRPIRYFGTVTILSHKLSLENAYGFSKKGPLYSGLYLKRAIRILGTKRVRVFFHWDNDKRPREAAALFLGTTKGTVAIAPRVAEVKGENPFRKGDVMITPYIRKPSRKFRRGLIYGFL